MAIENGLKPPAQKSSVYDHLLAEEREKEKNGGFDYIDMNGRPVLRAYRLGGKREFFQWRNEEWEPINVPPEHIVEECHFLTKEGFELKFSIRVLPENVGKPKYYDLEGLNYCDWKGDIYHLINNGTWEKISEEKQIAVAGEIHTRATRLTFSELQKSTRDLLSGEIREFP